MASNSYVKLPWDFRYSVVEQSALEGQQEVEATRQKSRLQQASISKEFFSNSVLDTADQVSFIWQLIFGSRGARSYCNPIQCPQNVAGPIINLKPEEIDWRLKRTEGIYVCKYKDESGTEVKEAVELRLDKKNPPDQGFYQSIQIYKIEESDSVQLNNDNISEDDKKNLIALIKENKLNDQQFRLGYLDLCLVIPLLDAFFMLVMETFDWACDTLFTGKNNYKNEEHSYLQAFTNASLKTLALIVFTLTAIPDFVVRTFGFPCAIIARAVLSTILTPFMFASIKLAQGVVTAGKAVGEISGVFNTGKDETVVDFPAGENNKDVADSSSQLLQ